MVHINGKDIDVAGQSLMDFLNANDYEMGTFVVECNEEIIHKEDYKTYILRDGDVIEIVQFMGVECITFRRKVISLMYGRCSRWYISDVSLRNVASVHLRSKIFQIIGNSFL